MIASVSLSVLDLNCLVRETLVAVAWSISFRFISALVAAVGSMLGVELADLLLLAMSACPALVVIILFPMFSARILAKRAGCRQRTAAGVDWCSDSGGGDGRWVVQFCSVMAGVSFSLDTGCVPVKRLFKLMERPTFILTKAPFFHDI